MTAGRSCMAHRYSVTCSAECVLWEQSSLYQGLNVVVTLGCKTQMLCTREFNGQLLLFGVKPREQGRLFLLENRMREF